MENKKDVIKQFGRSADLYIHSEIHRKGGDLKKLVDMALITGKEEVLDIATGGGHTANAFAPLVRQVTALDLTTQMLTAAQRFIQGNGHDNVRFVEGDAEMMPFSKESFDIAICRIAPHHFPNIKSFISEVYRILRYGGQFLLNDNVVPEDDEFDRFYNRIEKTRDYSHIRAWKKTEWIRMLETNGFQIQEFHRFEKKFEFETWCNRMHLSDPDKAALNDFMIGASDEVKNKFRIQLNNSKVESFYGEAMLLKAIKG